MIITPFLYNWCGNHAQLYCTCYNVYSLVAVSLFATFALICFQLESTVLLDANKNKLLLLLLLLLF